MTTFEILMVVFIGFTLSGAVRELIRDATSGETSAQRESRMHAVAEDQRQAAINEKREAQMLESHWTCPHCMTLVSTTLDACPACGGRLTLAILKAQGWKHD